MRVEAAALRRGTAPRASPARSGRPCARGNRGYPVHMPTGGGKRAKPGGHSLRPEVLAHHQRQRILTGAAGVFAKDGYRAVTVSDIVRAAAIARARFYENYSSKQDCFFALYKESTEGALRTVAAACAETDGDFPDRVRAGVEALLAFLDADSARARACIVEGPAVGVAIGPYFEAMIRGFAEQLRLGRADAPVERMPATIDETVVGGLYWLLYYAFLEADAPDLGKQAAQLTEFALIPFLGADAARA